MKDAQWRALAARNPMRATYPSWRPKEQRLAEAKKYPWVPVEANRTWWTRNQPVMAALRKVVGGFTKPAEPSGPPSGIKIDMSRPKDWGVTKTYRRGW